MVPRLKGPSVLNSADAPGLKEIAVWACDETIEPTSNANKATAFAHTSTDLGKTDRLGTLSPIPTSEIIHTFDRFSTRKFNSDNDLQLFFGFFLFS
jgi:hypothetical protein